MTTEIQLSLFGNNDPISLLMQEIEIIKRQNDNVRRGLFARQTELAKLVLQQQKEIDALKDMQPYKSEIMEEVLF
jgi:hypothetical protein